MRSLNAIMAAAIMVLCSCGQEPSSPAPAAPQSAATTPPKTAGEKITREAVDKVSHLLAITNSGRLTPLVREAERAENFQSNFGNQTHSQYWFLLRRVGIDPVEKLRTILSGPFGVKQVGDETWYIWPDFAAQAPYDLIPERLSFQDRARLREFIGDEGIARIRNGEPYPGVRTAISESGRWVYFIHDVDANEDLEQ